MKKVVTNSLRTRLLVTLLLWVVIATGATLLVANAIFRQHVEDSYHEELEVHVRELAVLTLVNEKGELELDRPLSDPRYNLPLSGFYWQVTMEGRRPLRSGSMTRGELDEHIAHSPEVLHVLEKGPTGPAITYGLIGSGPDGEEIHYVIATDQRHLDSLIQSFTRDLTIALVLLALVLLLVGYAFLGIGLRPLQRLRGAIGLLRSGERKSIEGDFPVEIAPLVSDLNVYAQQNEAMIAKSRTSAGNLAHSLRTPLAVITDEAERLASESATRESAHLLLEQARTMEQQIEYQLARARASSGMARGEHRVIVPDVAQPILKAMQRLHPEKEFHLQIEGFDKMILPIDRIDYAELLAILLDNAGKWAKSKVTLIFKADTADSLTASIHDDGPGMTDDQIERATEPGIRFDASKPGSGLGLAIAKEIADSLGLALSFKSLSSGFVGKLRYAPRSE
ncbi:sensor histidine kinase [Qipengyuania sp.]|uniref:sensor histidine kinase n=1 Tax=Qipengyuania sp. TaxID=2004515 RepID=UPI003BABCAE8